MGILQAPSVLPGQVGVIGAIKYMVSTDDLATITTAGYLNNLDLAVNPVFTDDILGVTFNYDTSTKSGTFGLFSVSINNSVITLAEQPSAGVALPTIANHIATYTNTTGTLSEDAATAINGGNLQAGLSGTAGTVISFPGTASKGKFVFAAVDNASNKTMTVSNASTVAQDTVVSVPDPGAATANFLLDTKSGGQSVSSSSSSATPGTVRALKGLMTGSNTTITSGNLVGVRGEVDMVGASGGFFYGAQGKVIPTGTLSGSSWTTGLFGQFDISAATVNGGQLACIWGDYGTTSGTMTDASGCRGIAMTNTTAAVLNAQDYRYGNATYLLELAGAGGTLNYYLDAGASAGSAGDAAHCAAQKVIKIEINGSAAYIPVFTQNT